MRVEEFVAVWFKRLHGIGGCQGQYSLPAVDAHAPAARVDGAGSFQILVRVLLPQARPALLTLSALIFMYTWNEFLLALLYIQDDTLKTIPTGLLAFSTRYVTDYSLLFSALSIVTLPMIVVYVVFNRQVTEGITAGSLK